MGKGFRKVPGPPTIVWDRCEADLGKPEISGVYLLLNSSIPRVLLHPPTV